jgi:hypothetical protein
MRKALVILALLFGALSPAAAQVSIGIGVPGVSIGINVPVYPQFVRVPGYPVYYAPGLDANFFFYDGAYWVFRGDNWYMSTWYNGPWTYVDPYHVPLYVLRVPVRYYRAPPPYFHDWHRNDPPHWGERWGHEWNDRHRGWEQWDHHDTPRPAPLPRYQRNYTGDRYPHAVDQRREIETRNYRYQPRDPQVQRQYEQRDKDRGGGPGDHGRGPQGGDDRGKGDDRGHGKGR